MHSKNNRSFKKSFTIVSFFSLVLILTACGNSEDAQKVKDALDVNQLGITDLQLTSPNTLVEFDATEQFTAQAIIGDGSGSPLSVNDKVKWSISDADAATINSSGLLTGKNVGLVTVTIQLADLMATKDIQLSNALLETIDIINIPTPVSVCHAAYQLNANGNYDDSTVRDLTDQVTWSSDNTDLLVIDETGAFATFKDGTATITVSRNSIEKTAAVVINDDIDSIAISTSSSTVNTGNALSFTATGTYDDASTSEITNNVNWISDTPAALSISNDLATKGVATGVTEGQANISATCLSTSAVVSNSVLIDVEELPVINGVSINEDTVSLEFKINDSPEQLVAQLTKSDGTFSTDVTEDDNTLWLIDRTISGKELTISNTKGSKGEITFTEAGITRIEVRYDDNDTGLGPFSYIIEVEVLAN
ncbi:MAG: hypothetical protein ACJAS1_000120 [Oleiphilaceae bacterium]|jgi:hypothetical protein